MTVDFSGPFAWNAPPVFSAPLKFYVALRYVFSFEGETEDLGDAFSSFVDEVGSPGFIDSGSDYGLVDRVLDGHGKQTKRKFFGGAVGKWVVDK